MLTIFIRGYLHMLIFIKLGKTRAVSFEINSRFGQQPVFKKTQYRCETILDMPYSQVIYTPEHWTPKIRKANDDFCQENSKEKRR